LWTTRADLHLARRRGLDAFLDTAAYAAERVRAARALYEFYVGTLYRHGLFNADPHPGNLLFAPDGHVTILDHGCVREFAPDLVVWLARLSRAVRADDVRDMQAALVAVGVTDPTRDFDLTRSILRGFYAPLLEPAGTGWSPTRPFPWGKWRS